MNLANKITLARIFLVPVFLIVLLTEIPEYGSLLAAIIFIVAASTDGLDGYIARSRKQVTTLGKFLDPLADKLLVSTALIALLQLDKISAWFVIIIISREFAVTGLRTIAAAEGEVISASKLGKIKTIVQIVAISGLILYDSPVILSIFGNTIINTLIYWIGQITLWLAVFFTVYSGVDYYLKCQHLLFKK